MDRPKTILANCNGEHIAYCFLDFFSQQGIAITGDDIHNKTIFERFLERNNISYQVINEDLEGRDVKIILDKEKC